MLFRSEENNLIAGGRQAPVINSPVNSYKHFPREVTFEDKLRERQTSLVVEETLAILTTNLVTTTLFVRPPTPRKQVPAIVVTLLKEKCLIKKHLKKYQLSYYSPINTEQLGTKDAG